MFFSPSADYSYFSENLMRRFSETVKTPNMSENSGRMATLNTQTRRQQMFNRGLYACTGGLDILNIYIMFVKEGLVF